MDINCSLAKQMIAEGAQLVDVRSTSEYMQGCLPGAQSIPLDVIQAAEKMLEKDKPVILYCVSGARSGMAKMALQNFGFGEVYNLGSFRNFFAC
ncbi:MAG: rhodanese-like domain-containing protein [Gammaproteobacteria bacterium]|nr:rhodanese-like domain-containing protein [Gammaproteobacteria bacterium]